MSLFQLQNPIPTETPDPQDLAHWIREHKAIPYFGTWERSSHLFLRLLRDLCELSPTYQIVLEARQAYTFGLNLNIVARTYPGIDIEAVPAPIPQQIEYCKALAGYGLTVTDINTLSKEADGHLTESGNGYLRVTRARAGGAVRYGFEVLDYLDTMYVFSDDPLDEFVLNSKFLFDTAKLDKYPPDLYRVTPAGQPLRFMEMPDGTEATVIHMKAKKRSGGGDYYGRTRLIAFLTWLYVDFQHGNHISKVSAAEFVTKKLLAIEGEDPNAIGDQLGDDGKAVDTFTQNLRTIQEVTTSVATKGNAMGPKKNQASIGLLEYPFGGNPPTEIDLEVNRDVAYLQYQGDKAEDKVAAALGWDTILTSLRKATATLGGNLLIDTFVLKNTETVEPKQNYFEAIWNGVIGEIMETEGAPPALRAMGIQFPNEITKKLEQLRPDPAQAAPGIIPEPQNEPQNA